MQVAKTKALINRFISSYVEESMAAIFFNIFFNDVIFILADFSRIGPVFHVLADLFCIGRVFLYLYDAG